MNTLFLEMFPGCLGMKDSVTNLDKVQVTAAEVDQANGVLRIAAFFPALPSLKDLAALSGCIKSDYGLAAVEIEPDYPRFRSEPEPSGEKKEKTGVVLMGKAVKRRPQSMDKIDLESGKVSIEGDVVEVTSHELQRSGGGLLCFDITDYSGSMRVLKFLRSGEDKSILKKIAPGDRLAVQGEVLYNKYEGDIVVEPSSIVRGQTTVRPDNSEEKRVELHLHTRFSAMDALTDPEAAVKRAAYWGMPAIAVTDHGVAQAFPGMWKAGKKYGVKIIYGMECYFVNDMDGNSAVIGKSKLPLDTELVAFDIETTGLNALDDRMTEIGAVIFSGGEIKDSFTTFVDPGCHIPAEITQLTGIKDSDVAGAPSEKEAMEKFIAFIGNRPLVAHNAHFDVGFMSAAARRSSLKFTPVFIDTLALSQALLPELKRFKLDVVSNYLELPKFNHHRATDDAMVVARIMSDFIPRLRGQGVSTLDDIETVYHAIKRTEVARSHHMVLLVQNRVGLKNLYEMISQSYLKYFHRTPIVPKSLLIQCREGILVGSACGMGELYGLVMKGADDNELEKTAAFYDYLEIQPICNNAFLVENGVVSDETVLQDYNRRILALGRRLGKPVVAAGDVHFLEPRDEQYRKILQAAKKFSDADRSCPIYFRNTQEMLEEFAYLGPQDAYDVVITATQNLASRVESIELLPKGLFPPKIEHSAEQLKELVYEKMHLIYGEKTPEIVQNRVDVELRTILDHNYDVIYMSAQKLVKNSLENGYLVGSRGSVGSSLVAFMSGITEVNSLPPHYVCPKCKYSEFITDGSYGCGADMPGKNCPKCAAPMNRDGFDIPFETFLGFPGNEKTPDIDLNFSGEYQARAHKYTETLFGADHVFRAGTIGTIAAKTAYGYVKKYLEERGRKATKAEENRLALGLVGIKRTTSQHPGGLVVIPQDMVVTDFCPVQHPADDADSGIITTHFEYHCMEDNLLKLDELGHDDPTMIRMLEDMTGEDARNISLSDQKTMSIFTSPAALGLPDDDPIIGKTGTIGVPEFGTDFTRQMLVDTKPTAFSTLVRLSGFSHGTDVWAGNIHDLIVNGIASVNETVGCRDDIMLYLISVGMDPSLAFKTMEAVRKGKVKDSGKFPGDAEEQMCSLGVPDWYVESCRKIAYLFPKAHAVAYVMMAFRIAWFKVHRPMAFYSAYFFRRSQKGGFDIAMMSTGADGVRKKISELRKREISSNEEDILTTLEAVYEFYMRGFEFAPVDLYLSDATKFDLVDDTHLRPPFVAITGLGEAAALDLASCRSGGKTFISMEELSIACPKVSQANLEQLRDLGALGNMPETSQLNIFDLK